MSADGIENQRLTEDGGERENYKECEDLDSSQNGRVWRLRVQMKSKKDVKGNQGWISFSFFNFIF